ncbi:hypothetical protein D0T50_09795 [Bacteroides sp. 214]|nr:hypothetical protein [Bacteroides sp. 214]
MDSISFCFFILLSSVVPVFIVGSVTGAPVLTIHKDGVKSSACQYAKSMIRFCSLMIWFYLRNLCRSSIFYPTVNLFLG